MSQHLLAVDEALQRLEPVRQQVLAHSGLERDVWLVGGVVRDALLGRPLVDIDVVVVGECEAPARRYAKAVRAPSFSLSDRWGCWRVALQRDHGAEAHVDFCSARDGSLQADLTMRDFTCNALAVPCWGEARLVDNHDGVADLQRRRLAVVSDTTFADDPLRLLRLARFSHLFEFEIDPHTAQLAVGLAPRASEPSGERTFAELSALLSARHARKAVRILDTLGLIDSLLPELARCRGVEQSHFHHLDVFEHTLAVLDNAEDVLDEPAHYFGTDANAPAEPFSPAQKLVVRFAALCHDLGKPISRAVEDDTGRIRFVGHELTGLDVVDDMCDRWATSNRFRDSVKLLVRTHLDLGMLIHGPLDDRAVYRYLRGVEPCAAQAVVLSLADRLATAGVADRRNYVRAHTQVAQHVWRAHWREQIEGRPVPLLDGREIAEAAAISPGPGLGTLVAALAEEQAVGAVTSREQAADFVRRTAGTLSLR